jgi:hypothetical protein
MGTKLARPSNGVSMGLKYTITSTDDSNGYIIFDFQADYNIVAKIQIVNSSNVYVSLSDAVITYPAVGQVRIADGSSFRVTATDKYSIIAQRDFDYSTLS